MASRSLSRPTRTPTPTTCRAAPSLRHRAPCSSRRRTPTWRSHIAPVAAGDEIELRAGLILRAIATPGHTPDHLAYLLCENGRPAALFSGGSLMVGTVGRTDLLGPEPREDLARAALPRVARRDPHVARHLAVYPTHGAGSFCSAPGAADRTTTIGRERATNPLLASTRRGHVRHPAPRRPRDRSPPTSRASPR